MNKVNWQKMLSIPAIGLAITAFATFLLFQIKFEVQNTEKDLEEVQKQIRAEKASVEMLKAEWSYLNRPERIRDLSKKYLHLEPITIAQIIEIDGNNTIKLVHDSIKSEKEKQISRTDGKWHYKHDKNSNEDVVKVNGSHR